MVKPQPTELAALTKQKHQHYPQDLEKTQSLTASHSKCSVYNPNLLSMWRTRKISTHVGKKSIITRYQNWDGPDVEIMWQVEFAYLPNFGFLTCQVCVGGVGGLGGRVGSVLTESEAQPRGEHRSISQQPP